MLLLRTDLHQAGHLGKGQGNNCWSGAVPDNGIYQLLPRTSIPGKATKGCVRAWLYRRRDHHQAFWNLSKDKLGTEILPAPYSVDSLLH